jgi:amino acid adenylation domain-containing protein
MFTATAARLADKTALVFEEHAVTYGQLDAASSVIGCALAPQYGGNGQIIPVLLPRGPEAVAALLGIWKAGAAGTMVDMTYPPERIKDILEQCGSTFVIDAAWINALDPLGKTASGNGTPAKLARDQLALVVFTSGSTGRPKGVMLPHRGIAQSIKALGDLGILLESDSWLFIVSMAFVIFVTDVLVMLSIGGTVHIASEEVRSDPMKMIRYVGEHGITTMFLPPSSAGSFMEKLSIPLRALSTGTEKVGRLWTTTTKVYPFYGATETCSACFWFFLDKPYDNAPIGTPFAGSRIYLLDEDGREVPRGVPGEMYIAGAQVALGYLNLPELTAESFLPNPFSTDPAYGVLYRTHDLVRLLPEGTYEYIQRADWMIKVRGFRVEPGEIEIAIKKSAPVSEVVVVGFTSKTAENPDDATRIYAVYTAKEKLDPQTIREALSRTLPAYMVPAFIEQLEALPKNARGKLDRSAIVPPDVERYKADYVPPVTETEKIICHAFARILGIERAGLLDDFTLLGGNSISAARIVSALPEAMGLSVGDILSRRIPKALAEHADVNAHAWSAAESLDSAEESAIELTPFHKIFYYEWLLHPDSADYNITDSRYLYGSVSYERLNSTLITGLNNHVIMNSNIEVAGDDRLVWKRRADIPAGSRFLDSIDHPLSDEALYRLISKPFDLEKDCLVRYFLIKEREGCYRFIFVGHHLVIDGTKSDEAKDVVKQCYNTPGFTAEKSRGEQAALIRRLSVKLKRLIEHNHEKIDEFWRNHLKDAAPVDMKFLTISGPPPKDVPAIPVGIASFVVEQKDLDTVRVIAHQYGITPYIYGQIIFAIMLNRMTGQKQVSFAFPAIIAEGLPLIYGSHINTLVVNYALHEDTTFEDLAEQGRTYFRDLELTKARYLPVHEIAKYLESTDILEVLFAQTALRHYNYQFEGITREEPDESLCIDLNGSFVFEQEERENTLYFRLRYRNRLFDKELIENFTGMYHHLFLQIAHDVCAEIEKA